MTPTIETFENDIPRDLARRAHSGTSFVKAANLATTFERLLALASRDHHQGIVITKSATPRPGHQGQPWTAADLVAQDALFEIQADLLSLLLEVAETLGPAMVARLTKALPWAYRAVPS